jgi:AraC-like DNA-binding protein
MKLPHAPDARRTQARRRSRHRRDPAGGPQTLRQSGCWDALVDRLAGAPDHARRVRLVEDLLLTRVAQTQPDPLMSAAAAFIERTQGTIRIEEPTRRIGLSQSALERRFRRRVGTSPRRFASIVRLKNVVRLHEGGADLTTIAHAAGYCDQAHFIHDFKRFTGVPPAAYFARAATG